MQPKRPILPVSLSSMNSWSCQFLTDLFRQFRCTEKDSMEYLIRNASFVFQGLTDRLNPCNGISDVLRWILEGPA